MTPDTDYLLIDAADGEEHDRFRLVDDPGALRHALADAACRAFGAPETDRDREALGEWLDHAEPAFVGRRMVSGRHGTWIVEEDAS